MNQIEVRVERMPSGSTPPAEADPIRFAELTDPERDVVEATIDGNTYTDCIGSESTGTSRFRERVRAHATQAAKAYLRYEGTDYSLYFQNGDHIIVSPEE